MIKFNSDTLVMRMFTLYLEILHFNGMLKLHPYISQAWYNGYIRFCLGNSAVVEKYLNTFKIVRTRSPKQ